VEAPYHEEHKYLSKKGHSFSSTTESKEEIPKLVMLCYQNFAGVRQAKLMAGDKFKLEDKDAFTKFSTYGLFLPASKDLLVPGVKFANAPK